MIKVAKVTRADLSIANALWG